LSYYPFTDIYCSLVGSPRKASPSGGKRGADESDPLASFELPTRSLPIRRDRAEEKTGPYSSSILSQECQQHDPHQRYDHLRGSRSEWSSPWRSA